MPYFPQRKYETNVASKHPSPQTFPTPRKKTIDQKGSRYTAPRRRSNRVIHRPMVQRRVSFYTLLPSPPFLERGQRAGVTLAWDATRSLNGVASMRSYTHAHTSAFRISPGPFPGGERGKKADSSRSETYQHGQWGSSLRPQPPPDWASLLLEGTPGFRYWTFPVNLARRRYYLRVSSLPSCSASWPSCSSAPVIRTNTAVLGENVLRASVPLPPSLPSFVLEDYEGGERGDSAACVTPRWNSWF